MAETTKVASGVQELISRLRDEGVKAGQEKSDQVQREAQEQASRIVAQAKAEAEEILSKARSEIETERAAANESLRVAIRDTELKMEAEVKADFAAHVRRLVSVELSDKKFLRQIILAIAGMAAGEDQRGRQVHVAGQRHVLRDLVELLHLKVDVVGLGAVDHALLQRGIDLAERHGRRLGAQGVEGIDQHGTAHDADLQALEVSRLCNRTNLVVE